MLNKLKLWKKIWKTFKILIKILLDNKKSFNKNFNLKILEKNKQKWKFLKINQSEQMSLKLMILNYLKKMIFQKSKLPL